jgi:hypothetical protein
MKFLNSVSVLCSPGSDRLGRAPLNAALDWLQEQGK